MRTTHSEIESQLDALAEICCESIGEGRPIKNEQSKQLTRALLMSGFENRPGSPLATQLEKRVRRKCMEPAMHRGAEVKATTEAVQKMYDDCLRWQSRQPRSSSPAQQKAVNFSPVTDS